MLGWRVSKNTVAALMAEMGLAARPKRRRKGSTRPGKGRWRAPDLVKRDFPAWEINQKWYGDGTDIDTDEGKLYLDSVLDGCSRRVLGFALGEHHDADLAYGALAMAVAVRGGQGPGVIFHTDYAEVCVKPRNPDSAMSRGLARLIPRLNGPVSSLASVVSMPRWEGDGDGYDDHEDRRGCSR